MIETQLVLTESQKQRKDFIAGIILIITSLILGKLVLIPLVIFPGNRQWQIGMLMIYVFSWIILLIGVYLAGTEGIKIARALYKSYQRRTVSKVKYHSKRAAQKTVEMIKTKARPHIERMRERRRS